jgi:hypothetical protein
VFIGIESPNEESLKETKKLQNVRDRAGTILERVHRIQSHGLDVWCGMIVGFDSDNTSIFHVLPEFLTDARIANALIGLLHAIPTTPLYNRLKEEGRLNDNDDSATFGTNVAPLGMSREELRAGFVKVTREAYEADAYFQRIDALFMEGGFKFAAHQLPYWRQHKWAWAKSYAENYLMFAVLARRLMRVKDDGLRVKYRSQLLRAWRTRPYEPQLLFTYAVKTAMHYHYASITDALAAAGDGSLPQAARSFSRSTERASAKRLA